MGVQYTGGPIVYDTAVPSTSSAIFRSALDAILSEVAIAAASVSGGTKYTLQSPDGLQMKVWIQDLGDGGSIRITPTSADEARSGPYALLAYSGDPYTAWADEAGFFVSKLGDVASVNNFGCAILSPPSASSPCNMDATAPTVTELWCSSAGNSGAGQVDWRDSRYCSNGFALSYNGTLIDLASAQGFLWLMPLCESNNVDWQYGSPGQIARYTSGTGLRIDPLVSIGPQIYGQIWDAHFYTLPQTVDSISSLTDTDDAGQPMTSSWVAWNNNVPSSPTGGAGTVLGTLMLLVNTATTLLANVAY